MESPGKSMPRPGLVSALRQGWAVQEDLALAEKIQQAEVRQHYGGNRDRNRQIRADIPQAKEVQEEEEVRKRREEEEHRERMQRQAERDARLAQELAGFSRTSTRKDSYETKRDEVFAKNLQRIEAEYRERQSREQEKEDLSYHDLGGGLQYQDEEYQVQVARPAHITEEPLYMNERREVGEADLWGRSETFQIGGSSSWAQEKESEKELLRTRLEARGFLGQGESTSHNTSTETAGTITTGGRSTTSRTSTSRSSLASNTSDLGACGGAAVPVVPDDFLGPRSLLSPEELKAAEAAEREFEQERRDSELARRLQEQLAGAEGGAEYEDQRLAREAQVTWDFSKLTINTIVLLQDREFAKVLQEREKAKARRAKEKARARKLERQREREEAITLAEEQSDEVEEQEGEAEAVGGQRSHRSPQSQDIKPPSRKPHMRATAIDSHTNDTYCTRQITPEHSDEEPR